MNRTSKVLVALVIAILLFSLSPDVRADNISNSCSGNICVSVSDNLAQGATGVDAAQSVTLGFVVYDQTTGNAPACVSPKNIYHAVRHHIAGSSSNYEYLSSGMGAAMTYQFNSGVDQQQNRYVGVFYCWTQAETNTAALDSLLGLLNSQGAAWLTPEFNVTTRAASINPNCAQITNCSQYPIQNDCSANRCNLSPSCQWSGNSCVATVAGNTNGYTFEITSPTGIETFSDLINVIGRWIFDLSIPIAVIMIIYAGILMLISGGKPQQFQKGMAALKWAVIGLAIVLIGKGFVSLIQSILDLRNS